MREANSPYTTFYFVLTLGEPLFATALGLGVTTVTARLHAIVQAALERG